MPRFRPVSVYCYNRREAYSLTDSDPIDLPGSGYSVVKVRPTSDGTGLAEVTVTFVYGTDDGDYVTGVFGDLALEGLATQVKTQTGCDSGQALLHTVEEYARGFRSDDIQRILSATPIQGHETEQRVIDSFAIGLASYLGYLCMLSDPDGEGRLWSQETNPFPFHFESPITGAELGITALNQNVFEYLNAVGQIVVAINEGNLGQQWMEQIMNFWNVWGDLFVPPAADAKQDLEQATREAMKGLSGYIGSMTTSLGERYGHLNDELSSASERIRCLRDEALVSCRLHKQTHLGDLKTAKDTVLDEIDDKLLEWDKAVKGSFDRLAQAKESALTKELCDHQQETLEAVEEAKHCVIEEIVRVKDECLMTLIHQDTFNERLQHALQGDPEIRRLVLGLVQGSRQSDDTELERRRQQETDHRSSVTVTMDQFQSRLDAMERKIDVALAQRPPTVIAPPQAQGAYGSMGPGLRIEIEQIKAEVVELRQTLGKVVRSRHARV